MGAVRFSSSVEKVKGGRAKSSIIHTCTCIAVRCDESNGGEW